MSFMGFMFLQMLEVGLTSGSFWCRAEREDHRMSSVMRVHIVIGAFRGSPGFLCCESHTMSHSETREKLDIPSLDSNTRWHTHLFWQLLFNYAMCLRLSINSIKEGDTKWESACRWENEIKLLVLRSPAIVYIKEWFCPINAKVPTGQEETKKKCRS